MANSDRPLYPNQSIHNGYSFASVTPDDNADLPTLQAALYVGTSGDVTVVDGEGNEVTFQNVRDGSWMPIRVNRVKATGTNATGIVAVY